jgi:hypothetical protein
MAVALIGASILGYSVRPARNGSWTRYTPSDVLLTSQHWLGRWSPRHARYVLEARLDRGELSARQHRRLAVVAVGALADNSGHLATTWGSSCLRSLGDIAIPDLEAGLEGRDAQQRQMCAAILRDRIEFGWRWDEVGPLRPDAPTPRLLEVTVEGLADDGWAYPVANATEGFHFLTTHGGEAAPYLAAAMGGSDPQQRLLAAGVVAHSRIEELFEPAIPMLIDNLAADRNQGNAVLAAGALFVIGRAAMARVEDAASRHPDAQCRDIARLIVLEWSGPARDGEDAKARNRLHSFSLDVFGQARRGDVPSYWITGIRASR